MSGHWRVRKAHSSWSRPSWQLSEPGAGLRRRYADPDLPEPNRRGRRPRSRILTAAYRAMSTELCAWARRDQRRLSHVHRRGSFSVAFRPRRVQRRARPRLRANPVGAERDVSRRPQPGEVGTAFEKGRGTLPTRIPAGTPRFAVSGVPKPDAQGAPTGANETRRSKSHPSIRPTETRSTRFLARPILDARSAVWLNSDSAHRVQSRLFFNL